MNGWIHRSVGDETQKKTRRAKNKISFAKAIEEKDQALREKEARLTAIEQAPIPTKTQEQGGKQKKMSMDPQTAREIENLKLMCTSLQHQLEAVTQDNENLTLALKQNKISVSQISQSPNTSGLKRHASQGGRLPSAALRETKQHSVPMMSLAAPKGKTNQKEEAPLLGSKSVMADIDRESKLTASGAPEASASEVIANIGQFDYTPQFSRSKQVTSVYSAEAFEVHVMTCRGVFSIVSFSLRQ